MPERAPRSRWPDRVWYAPAPPLLLRPLAALFGAIVAARRWCYRRGLLPSHHPGVPVIVVGNLTVGGTGKTPLVIWLASRLREAGVRPGVVLRGYGGAVRGARLVTAGDDPREVGDEALLVADRAACPVAVAARRIDAARLLVAGGCNLLICDDGLQHLALRRDLAIVVVDGVRGFGNGALLPAGPLREPAARLADADFVVLHGENSQGIAAPATAVAMTLEPQCLRRLADGREEPVDVLHGETVHAVAGIGHPGRFFAALRALGATPLEHAFPDHHRFRRGDLQFPGAQRIVMTEKDAVKCAALDTGRIWYLQVRARLSPPDAARLVERSLALLQDGGAHGA